VAPLDGPLAKLGRAEDELNALSKAIRQWVELNPYASSAQLNPIDDSYSVFLESAEQIPMLEWGLALGEVIHNARGALDHLVAALVIATGRDPHKRHQFPIVENNAEWERLVVNPLENRKRGFLDHIPAKQIALIKAVQPYTPATGKPSLLTLQRFSNADKHRVIHAAATWLSRSPKVEISVEFPVPLRRVDHHPPGTPLEDRTEIARVYPTVLQGGPGVPSVGFDPAGLEMQVETHVPLTTVFGEPGKEDTRIKDFRICLTDVRVIIEDVAAHLAGTSAVRRQN
jgi:hypothetical protein